MTAPANVNSPEMPIWALAVPSPSGFAEPVTAVTAAGNVDAIPKGTTVIEVVAVLNCSESLIAVNSIGITPVTEEKENIPPRGEGDLHAGQELRPREEMELGKKVRHGWRA